MTKPTLTDADYKLLAYIQGKSVPFTVNGKAYA